MSEFTFRPNRQIDGRGSPTNKQRAERGEKALKAYAALPGAVEITDPSCLQDLISDLLHLSDKMHCDSFELLRMAKDRWEEER